MGMAEKGESPKIVTAVIKHVGAIGRSREGIEIHNRNCPTVKARVFPEDIDRISFINLIARLEHQILWTGKFRYWHIPAGTPYTNDEKEVELLSLKKPLLGLKDIFFPGATILDMGCGGGGAAIGMAQEFPGTKIIGIDYELGQSVPFPSKTPPNLHLLNMDWRNMSAFTDNTIDRIISDQGVAKYGNKIANIEELTRAAKPGAILRATQGNGLWGYPNFSDNLASLGWDVYMLKGLDGDNTNIIAATLKNKM